VRPNLKPGKIGVGCPIVTIWGVVSQWGLICSVKIPKFDYVLWSLLFPGWFTYYIRILLVMLVVSQLQYSPMLWWFHSPNTSKFVWWKPLILVPNIAKIIQNHPKSKKKKFCLLTPAPWGPARLGQVLSTSSARAAPRGTFCGFGSRLRKLDKFAWIAWVRWIKGG
jgi:hypothetical protein